VKSISKRRRKHTIELLMMLTVKRNLLGQDKAAKKTNWINNKDIYFILLQYRCCDN
jgi:hypothetical protein